MGKAIIIPDLSFSINIGTVNIIESENIDVTSISITDKPTSITNSVLLIASVLPSNATNKVVTWGSSNTSIATVNSSGLVTVISAGTVTITATSQADNTKSDSITITITYSQEYPLDGLILKLDATGKLNSDSNATIWEDLSGNGNDFNLTNFEMTTSDGWDGTALVFKGTGTGLCRSISTLINGGFSTNGAITFFCKVTIMTNGRRTVFDATGGYDGGSVNDNYSIDFNYGFFSIVSKETRPTNKAIWSTPDLGLSKLIGVVKQNTTTNKIEMHNTSYGEGSNTAKNTYSILQPSSTARHMQIGLLGNTYGRMDGKIYDIMLYDRELTDLEITQVVNYLTTK